MRMRILVPLLLFGICLIGPARANQEEEFLFEPGAVEILAGLGEQGQKALFEMLAVEDPRVRSRVLEALVEHAKDPAPFLPGALDLLLCATDPGVRRSAGWLVSRLGEKGLDALQARLDASKQRGWHWAALEKAAPELASQLLSRVFRNLAPKPHLRFDNDGFRRTVLFGGGGGGEFEDRGGNGCFLVGLRHTTINWSGHAILRSIQPLYLVDHRRVEGKVHGLRNGRPVESVAKPGYAVGGLLVRSGHRIDGYAVVFMRIAGNRLDPEDFYVGAWQGGRGGGGERLLGGHGLAIAGICGRKGADIDALGLVERAPAPSATGPRQVRLTFSGRVDGSERIVIDAKQARWENVFWGVSRTTVKLGGVTWTPRTCPVLPNSGKTRFLSEPVDFSTARLVKTQGRDTVAIFPAKDSVTIRVSDNPNGTGMYEFSILLRPVGVRGELFIRATIDGSNEMRIDGTKATWRDLHWGGPRGEVLVNDTLWDTRKVPAIANSGKTRYLPDGIEFSTARVVSVKGRDLASLEAEEDHIVIRFADSPIGGDVYELLVRFGPVRD